MKDKMFLFPALILVLTPCVWYSNQPGVDGIQGIDFLLSPGCFLATEICCSFRQCCCLCIVRDRFLKETVIPQ